MDEAVKRLAQLDGCAVSDAMDKLGLAGAVSGLLALSSPRRIAGRVVTCRLVAAGQAPSSGGPVRHLGTAAIQACRPGDVIVVEQRTGIDAGSWGGILSVGAKVRQVAGVIADGPVRDVDEARACDLPVYARSATVRTARGRIAEAETNGPVTIGDVRVHPGDCVIADASGVVFVPAAQLDRVLQAAEAIAGREAAMTQALRAGRPISEVMGADYEHMLR